MNKYGCPDDMKYGWPCIPKPKKHKHENNKKTCD